MFKLHHQLQLWYVQLNYSEKGVKKIVEMFKDYKAALCVPEVVASFKVGCTCFESAEWLYP